MANTLLVKLAENADSVRVTDVIRLLRGVEAIETVPSESVRRLREAFAGTKGQGVDESFLRLACAAARLVDALASDPEDFRAAAAVAGVEEAVARELSDGSFSRKAAEALRITEAVRSLAPELLRRGRAEG